MCQDISGSALNGAANQAGWLTPVGPTVPDATYSYYYTFIGFHKKKQHTHTLTPIQIKPQPTVYVGISCLEALLVAIAPTLRLLPLLQTQISAG